MQGDDSTPTILREGPLTVALKSAHHDGAETEVQQEERASSFDHASDAETTRLVGVCRYRNACFLLYHLASVGHRLTQEAARRQRRFKARATVGWQDAIVEEVNHAMGLSPGGSCARKAAAVIPHT